MTPKQFLRQIEKPPLSPAYLLLGLFLPLPSTQSLVEQRDLEMPLFPPLPYQQPRVGQRNLEMPLFPP